MNREIKNLAYLLNQPFSTTFLLSQIEEEIPTVYNYLIDNSILVSATDAKYIKCTDCNIDHLENVVKVKDKYFIKCQYSENSSLLEINKKDLQQYHLSHENFVRWVEKECINQGGTEKLNDSAWFIGNKHNRNIYLIRDIDLEQVIKHTNTINTDNNVFLWLGSKPKTGYSQIEHYSLQDLLKIVNSKLKVSLPNIKSQRAKPTEKDLKLDTHIVLTKNYKLLLEYENGAYKYELNTNRQTHTIVRYLYNQRKYNKTYKSKELSEVLHIKTQRAVPTRIRELNKICEEYSVKQIVVKYPDNTWALNPELTCFNLT